MASTFFGLTISTNGVYAAQAALNTTAHNIANQNTKGYSRQNAVLQASEAMRAYSTYGMVGTGVEVTTIEQIRDTYYDIKNWDNASKLADASVKNNYNLQMEDYFNETRVEGFTAEYDNFFNALEDLKNNPSDMVVRTSVLNYASSMSDYLNHIETNYKSLQDELNIEVSNKVDQINVITDQIAVLTKQINTIELTGQNANDLRDKRNLLIDELSSIIPVEITEEEVGNGKTNFLVQSSGYTLVENYDAHSLVVVSRQNKLNTSDTPGLYDIFFYYDEISAVGTKFDVEHSVATGELKALFDLRDGNNGEVDPLNPNSVAVNYKGVPHYITRLNDFVSTFATEFNNLHSTGYNLYGDATTGQEFFKVSPAGVLTVNEDYIKDPALLAASKNPIQDGVEDSSLADELYSLKDRKIFNNTDAKDYLQSVVTEIAMNTQKSSTALTNYTNLGEAIQNQRYAISGVDADEEAMNLVKFQEAYNLSAKMIQVMSEIFDKLVNETGV